MAERNPDCGLLDLGCFDGSATIRIASSIGAKNIFGVDLAEDALKRASERGITTVCSDLNEEIPFDSNSFDAVFSNQVIEHLINPTKFAKEMKRVLKPRGYAIVSTENLASWHNIIALMHGDQPFSGPHIRVDDFLLGPHFKSVPTSLDTSDPDILNMPNHTKVFAFNAFRHLFEAVGFEIVRLLGEGYYPFPRPFSMFLPKLDPRHAALLTIKVRKPEIAKSNFGAGLG